MDIFYHFFVSLGLTVFFAFAFLAKAPSIRNLAPRLWHSEKNMLTAFITLVVIFSLVLAVTFGIWKEWLDGLGFGNVEFSDFLADLAGVWLGTYLVIGRVRREFTRRRKVSFRSQTTMRSVPVNLFRPGHSSTASPSTEEENSPGLDPIRNQLRAAVERQDDTDQ